MEGILDDAESIVDKFGTDKHRLKAFKTCRQALKRRRRFSSEEGFRDLECKYQE